MDSPLLGGADLGENLSKKLRTDDLDDADYSVSELLVELEWNPIENGERSHRNEDLSHAPSLCRTLGDLMRMGHLCDLTILVENGGLIPVHSCVMAAVSPVLSARLIKASPPIQVLQLNSLPGLSEIQKRALSNEEAVRNLLTNFAYYGVLELPKEIDLDQFDSFIEGITTESDSDKAIRLLAASMALQIGGAVVIVMEFLKGLLDIASCLDIFVAAHDLGCAELESAAESFVHRTFSKVVLEQSWVDAPEHIIRQIARRDELCARNEVEVFRAIARWCLEDSEHRKDAFRRMVEDTQICRLYLMSDEDLVDLQAHELVSSSEVIQRVFINEVHRRKMNLPIMSTTQSTRRFVTPQHFPESVTTSIDLPAAFPMPTSRHRGRSASVVLSTGVPQARPDNVVSSVTILSGHEKAVCALAANDNWIVSGSSDAAIRVWEMRTWKGGTVLRGHEDSVSSLRFFHGRLISGSFDKSIRIWNTSTWKFSGFVAVTAHEDPVTCLTVLTKTDRLASGSAGGEIKVWSCIQHGGDKEEWHPVCMLQNAHAHVLWSCCEWGSTIVSGSSDKEIRVWDATTWSLTATFTNHRDEVQALLVIGDELYSGSDDGVVAVHSSRDQTSGPTRFVELHRPVMALAEYQSLLAVGFGDGGIVLLNRRDLSKFGELKGHAASVMSLVTKNELLASGSFDKTVRVWEYHDKVV